MEYISAEEFLNQPKKVQKVFIDWWKPSIGDLYSDDKICIKCVFGSNTVEWINTDKEYVKYVPLLTEGHLRIFIEDKKSGIIDIGYYGDSEGGYDINIFKLDYKKEFIMNDETDRLEQYTFEKLGEDLLQAYWKVACEIAKEEVVEHGQIK